MVEKESPSAFDLNAPEISGDLTPKPKYAARISKKIVALVVVGITTVVMVMIFAIGNMDNKAGTAPAEKKNTVNRGEKAGKAPTDLTNEQITNDLYGSRKAGSLTAGGYAPTVIAPASGVKAASGVVGVPAIDPNSATPVGSEPIRSRRRDMNAEKTPEQQALEQASSDRARRMQQAREGGLSIKPFDDKEMSPIAIAANALKEGQAQKKEMFDAFKSGKLPFGGSAGGNSSPGYDTGPNGQGKTDQDEKLRFLADNGGSGNDRDYHKHQQTAPLSRYELKVGSYIPMLLETGMNSDMPGQIIGRSREGVYDSRTGCYLLIPPMTKMIGKYDSKVAVGQERMLFVWNVAVFKDGTELNLANMQGYDTSGMAGIESEVDNHYMKLMGMAFGMSMITAATNLALPPPPPGSTAAMTPSQAIGSAMVQQYGQLGAQIFGKYLNVQPTLKNYPGERFEIMVPRTIVFNRVWGNRCSKDSKR